MRTLTGLWSEVSRDFLVNICLEMCYNVDMMNDDEVF